MNYRPLPAEFIVHQIPLTWSEALWGIEQGWADWRTLVALAERRLGEREDSLPNEGVLASLSDHDRLDALDLARDLARADTDVDDNATREKWLYLVMRWIYENREQFPDALEVAEQVHADFGYPSELDGIIRYMPPSDGYNPGDHSPAENRARLYSKWSEYLDHAERQYQ